MRRYNIIQILLNDDEIKEFDDVCQAQDKTRSKLGRELLLKQIRQ